MDAETIARMAGSDMPEEVTFKDASRPTFNRQPGQVGIYVTLLDITPEDPKEYGSQKFMWQDLSDKLLDYLQTWELYEIKVQLENKGLLKGVVLDSFVSGLILAVSCNSEIESDVISREFKSGAVPKFFKSLIETERTLKTLRCTKIEVRISIYDDEIDACRNDFKQCPIILKDLSQEAYDRKVLRVARKRQQEYTKELYKLRDDQIRFEASLGEFLNLAKTYLPTGIREFRKMTDYEKLVKRAKERKATNLKILQHYADSIDRVREGAKTLNEKVLFVLAEVHTGSESEHQRETKAKINREIREVLRWLTTDFDYSKTRHPAWASKVMLTEKNMFSGLVCFLPLCIDKVIDADHAIDDYYDEFKVDIQH